MDHKKFVYVVFPHHVNKKWLHGRSDHESTLDE